MDSLLWNLFHDGSIERVEGTVPGDVSLHVSIQYLRDRFPTDGNGFNVRLVDCSRFVFEPYDKPEISDLAIISELEPEILSAEAGDHLEICCTLGTLFLCYKSYIISLDTGEPVAIAELDIASEEYWREWSERAECDRAAP
jgi:hypothetical protein